MGKHKNVASEGSFSDVSNRLGGRGAPLVPACLSDEALSEVLQGIFDTGSFELLVLSTRCASCYRTASGR